MKNVFLMTSAAIILMGCGGSDHASSQSDQSSPIQETAPENSQASDPAAALSGSQDAETAATTPATEKASITTLLDSDWRSEENKARDSARHPAETLAFFGLKDDMTVVELWPGGGWYAEIIAPFIAQGGGRYYAAIPVLSQLPPRFEEYYQNTVDRLTGDPAIFGAVQISEFGNDGGQLAPEGTADMVLTFRNVHNMLGRENFAAFLDESYAALKPGGILGIVEHRAKTDAPQDPEAKSGYVREDFTIETVTKAGFEFLESSEINANPRDTADHPFGVWTLPPSLRNAPRGEDPDPNFDQQKYTAIGESDRYTLKFQKPFAADGALLE